MAVKVKVLFPLAKNIQKKIFQDFVNADVVKDMNAEAVEEVKNLIKAGASPVQKGGRFPGYKNPSVYPGNRKGKRPTNLNLTGEMLSNYIADRASAVSVFIGIRSSASKFVKDKAVGNNEGLNGIPRRRFIPIVSEGETFAISVIRKIKNIYTKRLKDLLS